MIRSFEPEPEPEPEPDIRSVEALGPTLVRSDEESRFGSSGSGSGSGSGSTQNAEVIEMIGLVALSERHVRQAKPGRGGWMKS